MQRGRTGRVTIYEWRTPQEYSNCDISVQRGTSAISSSWYLEEEDTTNFKDYRKVTNNLKERAKLST